MENAITFLRIQSFKSIKDITLHPRRVNLIIGEPNVGKSNLLEAMTLLGNFDLPTTLPGFIDIVKDEDTEDNPRLIKLLQVSRRSQPLIGSWQSLWLMSWTATASSGGSVNYHEKGSLPSGEAAFSSLTTGRN